MQPHPYQAFLTKLTKPARYIGGEVGSIRKPWTDEVAKVCLAFPDVYDIGMSHLGFKILYKILNDHPETLAERAYAPWVDAEKELRERGIPLVSLESYRPLSAFDVVGFSLQFELTYTNILNMLDLGGIPLRSVDRGEEEPLVIAGGPVATHAEPLAPFIDAFVLGDGEEKATEIALEWKRLKREGVSRIDRLRALSRLGSVYVPCLHRTERDEDTGLFVVLPPEDTTVPFPIERSLVDINAYPFPDDSPVGGPEAIFDRLSIEIARGCTEGCRFCQAGMIYRPVRERDPDQIVDTVISALKKSGQDEVSLTALSTADVSCISPLIKKITDKLSPERVSLGVSSLRAYGLEPELLDELKRVRATGLTFAPEAGTQRMRDVINKNVTEEQLLETAERVFSRGWGKMKLYFICGLPTETEDDVRGIVETGARALAVGRKAAKGKPCEVTVSVSVHVPKPHTPFQWCAMDSMEMISRKQFLLRSEARKHKSIKLRTHDARASLLEGVFARGDRPLADVLEHAFRNGARFDSWDEQLNLEIWDAAFDACGVEPAKYLGTLPINARLPWSHLDIGLEDGFLAREYKKAVASRLSPPCGKVAGMFVHHTNVTEATSDTRKLVCYDCGVACDMTAMRAERITFLQQLGSLEPRRRLPINQGPEGPGTPEDAATHADELRPDEQELEMAARATDSPPLEQARAPGKSPPQKLEPSFKYRFRFEKLGPMAMLGHLDLIREVPRVFRRVGIELAYTRGFHPKPDMTFSPALSLGIQSLGEYVDLRLKQPLPESASEREALLERMTNSAALGLRFVEVADIEVGASGIARLVSGARYGLIYPKLALAEALSVGVADLPSALRDRCRAIMSLPELMIRREMADLARMVDVRSFLQTLEPLSDPASLCGRMGLIGDLAALVAEVEIRGSGGVKASEIAKVVVPELENHLAVRISLTLVEPVPAKAQALGELHA